MKHRLAAAAGTIASGGRAVEVKDTAGANCALTFSLAKFIIVITFLHLLITAESKVGREAPALQKFKCRLLVVN